MSRFALIGLAGFDPELAFGQWLDDLPALRSIMDEGIHGKLRTTTPPTSVPAWPAMVTSCDPGQLGIYGTHGRLSRETYEVGAYDSTHVRQKTIWNHLSRLRLQSLLMGVPHTWPPKPLKGLLISGPETPGKDEQWTHPREAVFEVDGAAGGAYPLNFRGVSTDNRDALAEQVYDSTRSRFGAFRHFAGKREFEFMMFVEQGADLMQHAFWRYMDPDHRHHEPGSRYAETLHDYYVILDRELGKALDDLPIDTSVMLVSDHGAKRLAGSVCVNEWLRREGYLTLVEEPDGPAPFHVDNVNWKKTRAWSDGGADGKIYLNVRDREPKGTIPAESVDAVRAEIREKLEALTDPEGNSLGTKVFIPEVDYREVTRVAPDLIASFGDRNWRAAGVVGTDSMFLFEGEHGPRDANNSGEGIIAWDHPAKVEPRVCNPYSIYDVAPTILEYFGIDKPEYMIGESLF